MLKVGFIILVFAATLPLGADLGKLLLRAVVAAEEAGGASAVALETTEAALEPVAPLGAVSPCENVAASATGASARCVLGLVDALTGWLFLSKTAGILCAIPSSTGIPLFPGW